MRNQTCCFTGHRDISINDKFILQNSLTNELEKLIGQGVIYFGSGGAIGFDTLAALTVLKLRKKYRQIKLIMVLPCKNQDIKWNERDKKIYNHILNESDKIVYSSEIYYDGCMLVRNRYLVDNSGYCICYLNRHLA